MKIKSFLHSLLPGIFLIGLNIGTGSVTSMSKAGANFGMSLLWTILLSCLITYHLILAFGRYTTVTGETFLFSVKTRISKPLSFFLLVSVFFLSVSFIMGVMGVVAEILSIWSQTWISNGIPAWVWSLVISIMIYFMIILGNIKGFEKILAVLVSVMGIAFILNFIIIKPDLFKILQGMIPKLPQQSAQSSTPAFLIIASMVGTTMSTMLLLMRSVLVKVESWTMENYYLQKRDTLFSVSMMFLMSMAVMGSASGTLYKQGLVLENVSEMLGLLEPLSGQFSLVLFVVGIVAAGLSSQFPNILYFPWMLSDYYQKKFNTQTIKYRLMILFFVLMNMVVPLTGSKPVMVMIIAMALNTLVLPITIGCLIYLSSQSSIMGNYVNSKLQTIILICAFCFALIISGISAIGLIEILKLYI